MPRPLSAKQFDQVESLDGIITDEEIRAGLKRLARIRNNLREIRVEISEGILNSIAECEASADSAATAVGELNAVLTGQSE